VIVAGLAAIAWWTVRALKAPAHRAGPQPDRVIHLLGLFAPGVAAAAADPRALLVWQPLAAGARRLFPEEFAQLDAATGGAFPFSADQIQSAHARWTADWLAWERSHDGAYRLKAAEARAALAAATSRSDGSERTDAAAALARAHVDDVEREKLELYQRRYEEYVRIAKALQALLP
jgi:hypothetical protein